MRLCRTWRSVTGFLGRHLVLAGFLLAAVEFAVAGAVASTDAAATRALLRTARVLDAPDAWRRTQPFSTGTSSDGESTVEWAVARGAARPTSSGVTELRAWLEGSGYRVTAGECPPAPGAERCVELAGVRPRRLVTVVAHVDRTGQPVADVEATLSQRSEGDA